MQRKRGLKGGGGMGGSYKVSRGEGRDEEKLHAHGIIAGKLKGVMPAVTPRGTR